MQSWWCPAPPEGPEEGGDGTAGFVSFALNGVPKTFSFGLGTDDGAFGFYYRDSGPTYLDEGYYVVGFESLDDVGMEQNLLAIDIRDDKEWLNLDVTYLGSGRTDTAFFDDLKVNPALVNFGTVGGRMTGTMVGEWSGLGDAVLVTLKDLSFDVERLPDDIDTEEPTP